MLGAGRNAHLPPLPSDTRSSSITGSHTVTVAKAPLRWLDSAQVAKCWTLRKKRRKVGLKKKKTTGCKWNPECFKSIYLQGLSTGVLCNCVCWRNSCVIGTNIYFCLGTFWLALLYLVQWFYSVRSRRCDCCSCRFNEISWLHRFLMVAKWNSCVLVRLHCQEFYLIIPKYPSFLKQIWFRSTDNKK